MANADIQQTMKQYRPTIMIGGGIALVLIAALVGWRVYEVRMTLEAPNVQTAPTAEVIAYVSHKRGLAAMPQIEQEQYLQKWEDLSMQPDRKEELKKSLTMLNEREAKSFVKQIMRYMKDRYIRDAEKFANMGRKDPKRFEFLRQKLAQYESEGRFIKEVAACLESFKKDYTPEKVQELIMAKTTPEEREVGKRFLDALDKLRKETDDKRKKLEAANQSAPMRALPGNGATIPDGSASATQENSEEQLQIDRVVP